MPSPVTFYNGVEDRYGLGKQFWDFITKLNQDSTSPGLHIEPVKNAADKRVRTARVTKQYRAVLFELSEGKRKHYLFVDVLNHDDAYDLATKKTLRVNPVNGITELIDATTPAVGSESAAEIAAEAASRAKREAAIEAARQQAAQEKAEAKKPAPSPAEVLEDNGLSVEQLGSELGLHDGVLELLSSAESQAEVDTGLADEPAWIQVAVAGVLAGCSLNEVREELDLRRKEAASAEEDAEPDEPSSADSVATESDEDSDEALIAGMKTPAAKMNFVTVEGEDELEQVLREGLDKWKVFLHPSQQRAVEANHKGAARVTGGAGTGKTVVVIHRTKYLLDQNPNASVLLTTYTRELANSLKQQMNELDPNYPEASVHGAPGLWISGIDALVFEVLKNAQDSELETALWETLGVKGKFTPRALEPKVEQNFWRDAAFHKGRELSKEKANPTFLAQEYSSVILTHGISDEKSYLRVRRTGRGTPLSRGERKIIWQIVQHYHSQCAMEGKLNFAAWASVAAHVVTQRDWDGMFDHVLIDEAQDFHPGHWRFLRAVAKEGPNDLFIAEDSHQRIYGQRMVLRDFGIETRGRATTKLNINYRTTGQNLSYATAILEGTEWIDSEEQNDELNGYRSLRWGPAPQVVHSEGKTEEGEALAAHIKEWLEGRDGDEVSIGVLTRTNNRRLELAQHLANLGVPMTTYRKTDKEHPVTVMTMHMAKGLEFTHVVLSEVSAKSLPQGYLLQGLADAEKEDALQRERALLYVAASRARDVLLVSVVGKPSELLPAE
ncbi:DNA helicase [Corynebacterium camporealensis]|uniref:DNA 3'-5' helicase n=1 Tax=Corynebacterium camporealensis TaxID=161896 RepID=A0A0F6QV07_9CORY|nr:UvrD-helicase domain-containing protein [Corynebacterium camporealensis]AKE38547.1 UvrD-like helicase C-terminal domain/UvrD/REP helicase N-terminal domain [Corynebacterium camporealensis]AVH87844.1 DNA helicase [Corynebacterium camporealensis]